MSSLQVRTAIPVGESIDARIRSALNRNAGFVARDLAVEVDQNDVVLRGAVNSWYQKQLAQETVLRVAGIGVVRNELTVLPDMVE